MKATIFILTLIANFVFYRTYKSKSSNQGEKFEKHLEYNKNFDNNYGKEYLEEIKEFSITKSSEILFRLNNYFTGYFEKLSNQINDFTFMMKEIYNFFKQNKKKNSELKIQYNNHVEDKEDLIFNTNPKKIIHKDNSIKFRNMQDDEFDVDADEILILSENNTTDMKNKKSMSKCSNKGNVLKINYTEYYCNNKWISKDEYNEKEKNKTLFNFQNCVKNNIDRDLCVCPKNLRGLDCELEVPFNCKIIRLFAKNNTEANKIDLLKNKNTFYYEYLNSPKIYFLNKTNKENAVDFNISINCTDADLFDYNYTITLGDIKQEQIDSNITDLLNEQSNLTNFDYFLEDNRLTVGFPSEIYLKFKIFNMDSLLPSITLYYPFINNYTFKSEKKITKNFAKNNTYNYNMFILNSDSIRNFICENYDCNQTETLEEIILKNYKDRNFYINFSENLNKYISRNEKIDKEKSFLSNFYLKDGLKFTSIIDEKLKEKLKEIKDHEKEKIKNFLTGLESFEFELNLNRINQQLLDLKNEYDLYSLSRGGRIFYEIEIVDELNDYISDCIYQGEIIINDSFNLKVNYSWMIYTGIIMLILISSIYILFFYKSEEDEEIKND